MQFTHQPLIYLYNNLDDHIKKCINKFVLLIIEMKENYQTDSLWVTDQKIGGIGAYAMPPNPVINPFSRGIENHCIDHYNMLVHILTYLMLEWMQVCSPKLWYAFGVCM